MCNRMPESSLTPYIKKMDILVQFCLLKHINRVYHLYIFIVFGS